jgi:tetratricopeptide (TPR) repeat protein
MANPTEIKDRLKSLQLKGDHKEAIKLCREALRLPYTPSSDEWFGFRLTLARSYINDQTSPISERVEDAISVYLELAFLLKEEDAKRRALAYVGLGEAYYMRTAGRKRDNQILSILMFNYALNFYTKESNSYMWASIVAYIALVYSEISDDPGEVFHSRAIKLYEDAIQVFTITGYPADHEEIKEKLKVLSGRLGAY